MKSTLISCFIFFFHICQALCENNNIDSIRIISINENIIFCTKMTRYDFFECIENNRMIETDVIIKEDSLIERMINHFSEFKIVDTLCYNTSQILYDVVMNKQSIKLREKSLDNRNLLILYREDGIKELIWVSYPYAEIHRYRYITSSSFDDYLKSLKKNNHY